MDTLQRSRSERLALLLAGGGSRCRRMVSSVADDPRVFDKLAQSGAPPALLDAAAAAVVQEVPAVLERVEAAGWRWSVPCEAGYPEILGHLSDPPLGLFVRGEIPSGHLVAVVGSRRATAYGRRVARLLGEELATVGVATVSGMARGVDAEVHEGSLAGGGPTLAVWGTGPDRIYPAEHGRLAEQIAAAGALLTEYPPGTPPRRHHFPERNRILAGLCSVVVVVEAAARSGALITARLALEEGREVMAVPGNIFSEVSAGPNALIRLGARPLLTLRDLFDALGMADTEVADRRGEGGENPILKALETGEALSVDDLAAHSGGAVQEVVGDLLELEISGAVVRQEDGRYRLR